MPPPRLPARMRYRYEALKVRPKKREESVYGLLDKLLNLIFSGESYMIKPQGPIRKEAEELDPDTSLDWSQASITANFSVSSNDSIKTSDSYGYEGDNEANFLFPDFIVCEYSPGATDDKPILVIEVKKGVEDLETGAEKLLDYLDTFGSRLVTDLCSAHGVIIAGGLVRIFIPKEDRSLHYKRKLDVPESLTFMDDAFVAYLYESYCYNGRYRVMIIVHWSCMREYLCQKYTI
ncbi:hypothetical protein ACGC1H_000031 [Rhizoctonia solani]